MQKIDVYDSETGRFNKISSSEWAQMVKQKAKNHTKSNDLFDWSEFGIRTIAMI